MIDKERNKQKGRQGGFLQLIILIIVALLILKFLGLTISDVVNWFKLFFGSVLQ